MNKYMARAITFIGFTLLSYLSFVVSALTWVPVFGMGAWQAVAISMTCIGSATAGLVFIYMAITSLFVNIKEDRIDE